MPEDLLHADPAPAAVPAADSATAPADPAPAAEPATPATPAAPAAEDAKYEFTAPEGAQLDDTLLGSFGETAKELGLSQDVAQKLLDKMVPAMAARNIEYSEATRSTWKEESTADAEFGGEKLSENLAIAKRGLEFVGSPKLITLLEESGLGNHPEVIRAFLKVGRTVGEDGAPVRGVPAGAQKPLASRLYDKSNMN